jgi:hypothetical protein
LRLQPFFADLLDSIAVHLKLELLLFTFDFSLSTVSQGSPIFLADISILQQHDQQEHATNLAFTTERLHALTL